MSEPTGQARFVPPPVRVDELVACGRADRPALTFRAETITYAELADRVARAAAGLHALGVRRGDRVAVYAEKRIETVVALLAGWAAGAVVVPVNPLLKARQFGHVVVDSGAMAVVTTGERLATLQTALAGTTTPKHAVEHVVLIGAVPEQEPGAAAGVPAAGSDPTPDPWQVVAWAALAGTDPAPVPDAASVIDADVAAILYTSGSTGSPKGVVLAHRNLLAGATSVATYLRHTADDVVLAVLPLSFDAGLSQLTTTLVAGAHLVLTNYVLARDVVRLCARHRVTGLTCVPPLWLQLVGQSWPAESAAHLRYFANTGGRMPRATLGRLRAIFPQALPYLMYGLTEAFRSTYLDPAEADRRPDSIGRAIPNTEILVLRPDGSVCDPGEPGELVHRGALVALGYWNDAERTAERFRPLPARDGTTRPEVAVWSGDTAYRDEEGFLFFVGRTDEMIKTSGYRVSPTEVEEAAYATGLVGEAVALGVADDRIGQRIVVVVTPTAEAASTGALTHEALLGAMAADVPSYMLPTRTVVLAELPRSANGKFDRVTLRDQIVRDEVPR